MPLSWRLPAVTLALAAQSIGMAAQGLAADMPPERNPCPDAASPVALGSASWNGWGRDLANTRYQPEPAMRAADVPKLALKWAFGIQGSVVSGQPTVVDGRLFVTSSTGRVYALDSKTGCTYWTFDAEKGTRTAISIGELAKPRRVVLPKKLRLKLAHVDVLKAPSAAVFGDDSGAVSALDAQQGTLLWKTQVDSHPFARIVGAPTVYRDRVYVAVASSEPDGRTDPTHACCTFRGSVAALDIATGRLLWKTHTIGEVARALGAGAGGVQEFGPAGVAVSVSPTIDVERSVLYVATGSSYTSAAPPWADSVLALDLNDGGERWVKQLWHEDRGEAGFESSLILRNLSDGRQILLAGQTSGIVYALDPEARGEILWQSHAADPGVGGGAAATGDGVEWGFAADHRSLYVALSGLAAEPPTNTGSLSALDLKTGVKRWHTPSPAPPCAWGVQACFHAQAQAVTVMPGIAFSGSMDGHLRAYSTIDGKIVWDVDTAQDYATVNGIKASGGSLDRGGAIIVNGILYINSGYADRGGQPGNVLLAFSVDGK